MFRIVTVLMVLASISSSRGVLAADDRAYWEGYWNLVADDMAAIDEFHGRTATQPANVLFGDAIRLYEQLNDTVSYYQGHPAIQQPESLRIISELMEAYGRYVDALGEYESSIAYGSVSTGVVDRLNGAYSAMRGYLAEAVDRSNVVIGLTGDDQRTKRRWAENAERAAWAVFYCSVIAFIVVLIGSLVDRAARSWVIFFFVSSVAMGVCAGLMTGGYAAIDARYWWIWWMIPAGMAFALIRAVVVRKVRRRSG